MDRARAVTRKVRLADLDDEFDRVFWARLTAEERFAAALELSEDLWRFKGWRPDESGFPRSVTRVTRR
jgi:hypothetical protein